jgi:prepilin-type N-terminal cleavage/methylation domain-containing protein
MKNTLRLPQRRGFTLIELLVVVALASVLLALAVPNFIATLAKNRFEGAVNELVTDMQYARSEAVARNIDVTVAVGATRTCYTVSAAGACDCTASPACSGGPVEIKTVQLADSGAQAASAVSFAFEPVRGALTGAQTQLDMTRAGYPWQLRAEVAAIGRVRICSPSGFTGYPSC